MKTRPNHHRPLYFYYGAALISALSTPASRASNEALSLAVQPSSPGGVASAHVKVLNGADVQSFSLKLSFASGGILSLPAAGWLARGDYFPSLPFGPDPRVEANHSADGGAHTRVLLDGFAPAGTSGSVGRVSLKVSNTASPGKPDTNTPPDSQIVTLSGEFWSRSEQKLKTLPPVSVEFTVVAGDNDGDGIPDGGDPDDDNDGVPDTLDSRPKDAAFRGSERVTATLDQDWTTITLPTLFDKPVVIAGPPSYHDGAGGVARVRNIAEGTFDARFQEWDYLDGAHPAETVPYLVVEARRQIMPDGSVWEAGAFSLDGAGAWKAQKFSQAFAKAPRLFLTVQSANDASTVAVRARKVTAKGFEAALFEEQIAMPSGHGAETVGYLAIHSAQGSGMVNIGGLDLPYLLQQPVVDERWTPVLSSDLSFQEEKSLDVETNHRDEKLSVLGLGNQIYAQDTTSGDADPGALRIKPPEYNSPIEWGTVSGVSTQWVTIPLAKTYVKPVVVAKLAGQAATAEPGVVRQRNAASSSFQARYQEWDYLDGIHGAEKIFYMVAERGSFDLGGLKGEARHLSTDQILLNGTAKVTYTQPFSAVPGLFSSVMSHANADAVTTRVANSTTAGFGIAMQEQESNTDGHAKEILGWIAIQKGIGLTDDGRRIQVLDATANHLPTKVTFTPVMKRRFPVLIDDLSTSFDFDPAVAAQTGLTPSQVQISVQEEQSLDAEIEHGLESISVFGAE
jgi:hypothetical protein